MIFKAFTFSLFLLFSLNSIAQSGFDFFYNQSNRFSFGSDIIATSDGGSLAIGSSFINGVTPFDTDRSIILKLDNNGNISWITNLTFEEERNPGLHGLEVNDGYLIMGTTVDTVTLFNGTMEKNNIQYLTKLNWNGEEVWTKYYPNHYGHFAKLLPITDGYLTAVYRYVSGSNAALFILKLDEDGEIIEEFNFSDITNFSGATANTTKVIQLQDGNFLFTTWKSLQAYVFKMTPDGLPLWERNLDIPGFSMHSHELPDGKISIFTSDFVTAVSFPNNHNADMHFTLNADGTIANETDINDDVIDKINDAVFIDNENIFAVGQNLYSHGKATLVKMSYSDTGVETSFIKDFEVPDSLERLQFQRIAVTNDDHLLIIGNGWTNIGPNSISSGYIHLLKVNMEGDVLTSTTIPMEYSDVQIFPNPTSDIIQINGLKKQQTIKISDVSGRILKTQTTDSQDLVEIDIRNFNSGIYFVRIGNEFGDFFTKKIIKE